MRIDGLVSQSIQKNNLNQENTLKSGAVIKGRIADISGNNVTINLSDGNFIKGRTQIPLHGLKGQMIEFLIKEASGSKLVITPLENGQGETKQEGLFINNILDKLGFLKSDSNIEIVKTMLKYKMPLKQETVDKMARSLGKLEDFANLKNDEKLQVISPNGKPLAEDIDKIVRDNINNGKNKNDITNSIKSKLEQIISSQKTNQSLINKVAFLIKNDMKVSLNNLGFLTDIINNEDFTEEDIRQLINEMGSKGYNTDKINQNLEKFLQGKVLNFDSTDKDNLKDSIKTLASVMEEINTVLESKGSKEESILNKIDILNSKIEFLNEINQNNTFYYIPFKVSRENLEKNLLILNKRRRNKKDDSVKIFISLDMSNIKKVDVLLHKYLDKLNIDFTVQSEKIIKLMESKEDNLKSILRKSGFEDVNISFSIKDEHEVDPIELLSDEDGHNYLLDVRV